MAAIDRRHFLKTSAALAAAATCVSSFSQTKPVWAQAPSDRLRMACVGVGNRGGWNAYEFNGLCDIVALCDLDLEFSIPNTLSRKIGVKGKDGQVKEPDIYTDYRKVLERDDIDVVSIGTPDHWHVKIAVEAMQAGKHVFCEKPVTLTIEENKIIRKAVEKYGKIFQAGTMQRSMRGLFPLATLIVRGGYIGDVKKVVCDVGGDRTSGDTDIPKMDPPKGFDWNTYLGQAPYTDFLGDGDFLQNWREKGKFSDTFFNWRFGRSRCHNEFRWWYETAGGKFTDWGAHHIDCALWALGLDKKGVGPVSVDGTNAQHPVPFKDGYPTVHNRYNTSHKFDIGFQLSNGAEMRVASSSPDGLGILFEGTKGRFYVNRERITGKIIEQGVADEFKEEDYVALYNGKPWEVHKHNFIRCIREGGKPVSDVWSHVQAMHACHLCSISARLNRKIEWDPVKETIVGDEQAASFMARKQREGFEIPAV